MTFKIYFKNPPSARTYSYPVNAGSAKLAYDTWRQKPKNKNRPYISMHKYDEQNNKWVPANYWPKQDIAECQPIRDNALQRF